MEEEQKDPQGPSCCEKAVSAMLYVSLDVNKKVLLVHPSIRGKSLKSSQIRSHTPEVLVGDWDRGDF